MATDLLLPDGFAPTNLHLKPSVKARFIESDVLNICERIAEISPLLYLVELSEDGRDEAAWAVMEICDDGVHRLVVKVKDFDARVVEKIAYLWKIPFHVRLKAIEEENERWEKQQHDNEIEELYDRIGQDFWRELERCNFIQRPVSYPKIGVAAPGRVR